MIQNKIRAKSFQVSNIFWIFYVYLLGSAVLVVVYTLDFNFICVNNMVYMTSLLLNPIPTSSCHVILIYGLIPPSAGVGIGLTTDYGHPMRAKIKDI